MKVGLGFKYKLSMIVSCSFQALPSIRVQVYDVVTQFGPLVLVHQ